MEVSLLHRHDATLLGSSLVLFSAVLFSLSGVLTKAIEAGSWTILTWRGLIGGVGIAMYVAAKGRANGSGIHEVFRLGRTGSVSYTHLTLPTTPYV